MTHQPVAYYQHVRDALQRLWKATIADNRDAMRAAWDEVKAAIDDRPEVKEKKRAAP